jgi:hypothetical protein
MINRRAISHEAGHAIVAKNFGIEVRGIFLKKSIPMTCVDTANATLEATCVVFAGGVAAEKALLGNFDNSACSSDRELILQAGGGDLEQYLEYATEIIQANLQCIETMINEINKIWVEEEASEEWSSSNKLSFTLIDKDRVDKIWDTYHPTLEQ